MDNKNQTNNNPTKKIGLKCLQIKLGRGRNALHEIKRHTYTNPIDILLITEPYTGKYNHINHNSFPGYTIHQFPHPHPVKAAILTRTS